MAGVTAIVDFPTTGNNRAYAFAASAYVPIDVSVTAGGMTASAPVASVIVTTDNTGTSTVNVSLNIRVACVIGSNVMFAPSGSSASTEFTAGTGGVS